MIGVDEVGRGALAGPLLVCAARLKQGQRPIKSLTDSKKLNRLEREELFIDLTQSYDFGEAWISNKVIDKLGLAKALKCGFLLALQQAGTHGHEEIIIDGSVNYCNGSKYTNASTIIKADAKINEVSAASIYAKLMRDNYMYELHESFSEYGFYTNVGYGTEKHRNAIQKYGPTRYHRNSFSFKI